MPSVSASLAEVEALTKDGCTYIPGGGLAVFIIGIHRKGLWQVTDKGEWTLLLALELVCLPLSSFSPACPECMGLSNSNIKIAMKEIAVPVQLEQASSHFWRRHCCSDEAERP